MADYGGPGNIFLQGFGLGSSSAAQSMNTDLRRQQLISEDRSRRLQEAQTAQRMSMLMEEHSKQVDYAAAMAKAAGQISLSTAPTIPDEGPDGIVDVPNPNRLSFVDAQAKFALPVLAKYDPKNYETAALNLAHQKLYEAQADKAEKDRNTPFVPTGGMVADPRGPEYPPHAYLGTGKGSVQYLQDGQIQTQFDSNGNPIRTLPTNAFGGVKQVSDAGLRQEIGNKFKNRFEALKFVEKNNPAGIVTGPDGEPQIVPGALETAAKNAQATLEGPTTTERSNIQRQTLAGEKLADSTREMAKSLTDLNVGPTGAAKSLYETITSWAGMPLGSESATETRAALARFREELAAFSASQGLNAGTKQRLALVMHDIPDADKFITGGPIVKLRTAEALTTLANDMSQNYKALGKPIPDQWEQPEVLRDRLIAQGATADEIRGKLKENIRAISNAFKGAAETGK